MTELKDRFSLADEIVTRDLWGEARRRAAAPEVPPRAIEWPPGAGRRVAAAAVALAVFATATVFAWELSHPELHRSPAPAVDLGGGAVDPGSFVPATETTGDTVGMPLVFPDGTRATLVYAEQLRLAELGIQPDVSYVWTEHPPPRFPIVFLHDRYASIARFVEGTKPVGVVISYRSIEIWKARGDDVERRFWLRYHLPSWTVLVSVRDASTSAGEVAAALELRETHSGFPVVGTSGPIELAEGFGEAGGAQLAVGDGTAEPDTVSQLDATIFLSPDGCGVGDDEISPSGDYASLCLGGRVLASIYGSPSFVRTAFDSTGLEGFLRT